jgi:hypothetical protein
MDAEQRKALKMAAEEHDYMGDLILAIHNHAGYDQGVEETLNHASRSLLSSQDAHEEGNYEKAHKDLQVTAEHISTAAALGNSFDRNYGFSMSPRSIAGQHVTSYKHGFLS